MDKISKNTNHLVIDNLIKIMNESKLTKTQFAEKIGLSESKWNKISNGNQRLSIGELSEIAEKLGMREIDIYTYPKEYVEQERDESDIKAQITIELKDSLKKHMLKLIFGKEDLEILDEKKI
ncbi:MAG: helix-turn-helix domain-containing protein [Prevotella sp.]|jgi:transcriptional regulator with XRE-family HTH domain|nr:helix-turn-helix domain-containing protein [Prevotella sp.]